MAPLGIERVWTCVDGIGYGYPGHDDGFAIKSDPAAARIDLARTHLAFRAASRRSVRDFHAAALAFGAVDEGPPESCVDYGANYFAAFVRDPDGHRLEAVCHE